MTRTLLTVLALSLLVACEGSNPLQQDETETEDDGTVEPGDDTDPLAAVPETTNSIDNGRDVGSDVQVAREEARTEDTGGGYALDIAYLNDAGQDVFFVDNLPFDGDNSYNRSTVIASLDANDVYRVYEADATTVDPLTGNIIDNFDSRAIYARSNTGATEFAIVRSGSYEGYGFGGFVYQRNALNDLGETVTTIIPDPATNDVGGTAEYIGDYAAIRVYDGTSGLNYVQGDSRVVIDFQDFNENDSGVQLQLTNRVLLDINGTDVTDAYLNAVEAEAGVPLVRNTANGRNYLPNAVAAVGPGTVINDAEISNTLGGEHVFNDAGTITTSTATEGTYYALISGENAEEIVGIVVVEGTNGFDSSTTFQETGGFIVYRQ